MSMIVNKQACFPDKAQYLIGETVNIHLPSWGQTTPEPIVCVSSLHRKLACDYSCKRDGDSLVVELVGLGCKNYGIALALAENEIPAAETAFDIVPDAAAVTRYGFLTDFAPEDNHAEDVASMRRLHLNAVQFYDWMYRHDQLVAPTEEYEDALGKITSRAAICTKTEACKQMGIRPFAYGAVYAATPEFCVSHPGLELRTSLNTPLMFGDGWLHFMDITPGSAWNTHLLAEYARAIKEMGFMGIHMDTYGFPKYALDARGRPVSLRNCFAPLINQAADSVRAFDGRNGVIFNAVNNWPIDKVAETKQDAVYIEVWPPHESYIDLYHLVRQAKQLSGDKAVVLAAYMEPFRDVRGVNDMEEAENAFLLANAVINAAGGTQLALGGNQAILCDSYYTHHAKLRREFVSKTYKYSDFLVQYAELLYADAGSDVSMSCAGGINQDIVFAAEDVRFSSDAQADTVWTVVRESENRISVNMVNLRGNDTRWNEKKHMPTPAQNIRIAFRLDREIAGVYWASPDSATLAAKPLDCVPEDTPEGRVYKVVLPCVRIWTAVWIEFEQ